MLSIIDHYKTSYAGWLVHFHKPNSKLKMFLCHVFKHKSALMHLQAI